MPKKIHLAPDLSFPLALATDRIGIVAVSGAGKSNTARVMAEEFYGLGVPVVVIDTEGSWWGIQSSGNGKAPGLSIPIFGGDHADVPLEPTAGVLMADLIADRRLSCVLDLEQFSGGEQTRFLTDFAQRLLRRNRKPIHIIMEEADRYVPQKPFREEARMLGAWEKIVRGGRKKGIGVTMITQRSAVINKNVWYMLQTMIAMRTTAPADIKSVVDWMRQKAIDAATADSLPELKDGEAWVWSPVFKVFQRIKIKRQWTFDSAATPTLEKVSRAATKADLDLDAIRVKMAETIERARAEDPKELRQQVAQRDRQIVILKADLQMATARVVAPQRVEVPVIQPEVVEPLVDAIERADANLAEAFKAIRSAMTDAGKVVARAIATVERGQAIMAHAEPARVVQAPMTRATAARIARADKAMNKDLVGLATQPIKAGARRMLEVLAWRHPLRVTRAQLATLAGFSSRGGTYLSYLSTLRTSGFMEGTNDSLAISERGLAFTGKPAEARNTLEVWRASLKAGERKILDWIVERHPQEYTITEVGAQVGMAFKGGTFLSYISVLRSNGLIESRKVDGVTVVRASDTLFM